MMPNSVGETAPWCVSHSSAAERSMSQPPGTSTCSACTAVTLPRGAFTSIRVGALLAPFVIWGAVENESPDPQRREPWVVGHTEPRLVVGVGECNEGGTIRRRSVR